MTGLKLIIIKNRKVGLLKVRDNGYCIENYIKEFPKPINITVEGTLKHFKEWYQIRYNKTDFIEYLFEYKSTDFDILSNKAKEKINKKDRFFCENNCLIDLNAETYFISKFLNKDHPLYLYDQFLYTLMSLYCLNNERKSNDFFNIRNVFLFDIKNLPKEHKLYPIIQKYFNKFSFLKG